MKVYAIIVTYNGMQWIDGCLASLVNSSLIPTIIVADNGSTDATTSFIRSRYPQVTLIETGMNLGFGQANNTGFRIAISNHADFVFLLNQDARVEKHTLSSLVDASNRNPQFGILSPLQYDSSGKKLDIYFERYLRQSGLINYSDLNILAKSESTTIINTEFVNAAAWLIRVDCIKRTGGFDRIFPHYGEDTNYVHRVLFKGFEVGIHLHSKIFHDREQRILSELKKQNGNLEKDWIQFLCDACDIRYPRGQNFLGRRMIRHSLLMLTKAVKLKRHDAGYHFQMAKRIAFNSQRILRSRTISIESDEYAHLEMLV